MDTTKTKPDGLQKHLGLSYYQMNRIIRQAREDGLLREVKA